MKKIPAIKAVMTPFPYWIDGAKPLAEAENMMIEHDISHLPVKENGEIIGVIAKYDINAAKSDWISTEDIDNLSIKDICVPNPYVVDIDEPLDNVVMHMAYYHIGSALVVKKDRLAGVFTVNDACRCFGEYLREQYRPSGGNDIA